MDSNYIGKKVDNRYDVVSLIGVGGMSNVYKAIDTSNGNTVAIKFLKQEFFENEELVRRFKNESKAISLLNNPNIIKVVDVNITEEEKYIVVEYIDGITLKKYIDNRKVLSWQETVQFTGVILSAIGHAHKNGIIHRDLKPQNVMLLRDGSLKIMDFGIARLSTASRKTVTDKAIGSVHYISPEQVRGKNSDGRSDIYSIGIMMYEMITGTLPFVSDSAVSVAMKQVSDTAVRPSEIVDTIPQGLEQIVLKAIEKNAADRYQSTDEMLKDLNEFKLNPAIVFPYGQEIEKTQVIPVKKTTDKKKTTPKKPKVKKNFKLTLPIMAGVTAAFAVSSLIACLLIFKLSGNPLLTSYEDIELPSFVGMSEADMKNSDYKLRYEIEYVFSAEHEQGTVISQAPRPPKTIKENSTISVKVSKGPDNTPMPNLVNYPRSEAERILSEMEVNVTIVTLSDKDVDMGFIIKTEPEAGIMVSTGGTVTMYVSRGDDDDKNKSQVPNVVGLTSLEEAKKVLAKNSLRVGSFLTRTDSSPEGTILEQNPGRGTELVMGGAVDLVISSGPIICGYCEGEGHEEGDCDVKRRDEHTCTNCKDKGHYEDDCPMKSYSCKLCGKPHYEKFCPDKCKCGSTEHKTSQHKCERCGDTGHIKADCTKPECSYCKVIGHNLSGCTTAPTCGKCSEKGHDSGSCTKPYCDKCTTLGHEDTDTHCATCGEYGHTADDTIKHPVETETNTETNNGEVNPALRHVDDDEEDDD